VGKGGFPGRGLGETSGRFCGDSAAGRRRAFTASSAFVVFLDVCGFAEACGRCGEFWAKAFVGLGGLGRQKGLRRAQNLAKLRSGFGEAKPWQN